MSSDTFLGCGTYIVVRLDLVKHVANDGAGPLLVRRVDGLCGAVGHGPEAAGVVWVGAVVAVDGHEAVALVGVEGVLGGVYWDLLVVDAQAVAVRVAVREEARLQDRVGRGLDAGHQVRGRKGDLLDLGKVVLRVLVEGQLAEPAERHLALRPDLGQVKDVPLELLGFLWLEDLHVDGPAGVLAALNGLEQVLGVPVGVLAGHLGRLLVGEVLDALVRLEVDLDVDKGAVGPDKLVSVARVAVHVTVAVRGSTVREEGHNLVDGLVVRHKVIPKGSGILEVCLGVLLLCVDEQGEVCGIPKEEDGSVVVHPVPVTFLGIKLYRETSGVSGRVCGTLLTTDGRESGNTFGLLANTVEHVDGANIANVIRHLKLSKGASTLGMDDTLGDTLAVKVGEQVDQVKVLQQKRTGRSNTLPFRRVIYWATIGGCVDGLLVIPVGSGRGGLVVENHDGQSLQV